MRKLVDGIFGLYGNPIRMHEQWKRCSRLLLPCCTCQHFWPIFVVRNKNIQRCTTNPTGKSCGSQTSLQSRRCKTQHAAQTGIVGSSTWYKHFWGLLRGPALVMFLNFFANAAIGLRPFWCTLLRPIPHQILEYISAHHYRRHTTACVMLALYPYQ